MTPTQKALQKGRDASEKYRGVSVTLRVNGQPTGPVFTALVEPVAPQPSKYQPTQPIRTGDKLHISRAAIAEANAQINIGASFVSEDGNTAYRVTEVGDNPISLKVVYTCETAPVPK
ncbi:MAG TPA: hypothetical protein VFC07_00060 [Verrucomicrobiae bacterium]|nr:hypothetical protein [Verrucomicrobiae bacterium]